MNEELLPCPFCGGAATIEESALLGDIRKSAGCGTEHCQGYQSTLTFSTHREAIAAWNTRVAQREIERLKSEVRELRHVIRRGAIEVREA